MFVSTYHKTPARLPQDFQKNPTRKSSYKKKNEMNFLCGSLSCTVLHICTSLKNALIVLKCVKKLSTCNLNTSMIWIAVDECNDNFSFFSNELSWNLCKVMYAVRKENQSISS
jgi:hypothetical protein